MNLSKLFEMQSELDKHIEEEHPSQEGEDRLAKKILALQVELGELANEWQGFKFWKSNPSPRFEAEEECYKCEGNGTYFCWNYEPGVHKCVQCDECEGEGNIHKQPLLEEYVDCLHFILSIGLELNASDLFANEVNFNIGSRTKKSDVLNSFKNVYKEIQYIANGEYSSYILLLSEFTTLGDALSFTEEQIEQAYLQKNEVNHQRQESGY